jgi:hypothetical protein
VTDGAREYAAALRERYQAADKVRRGSGIDKALPLKAVTSKRRSREVQSAVTTWVFATIVGDRSAMKLSAKFARQESEEARLARITRRRVPSDRAEAIRRMLSISEAPAESTHQVGERSRSRALLCSDCDRAFTLPMHLGRHRKTKHGDTTA